MPWREKSLPFRYVSTLILECNVRHRVCLHVFDVCCAAKWSEIDVFCISAQTDRTNRALLADRELDSTAKACPSDQSSRVIARAPRQSSLLVDVLHAQVGAASIGWGIVPRVSVEMLN